MKSLKLENGSALPFSASSLDRRVEILQENITALEHRVAQLEATRVSPAAVVRPRDHALLVRLLPAIAGAMGSEPFTSRDLVTEAAPGVRVVLGTRSVRTIGKLFSRAANIPVDGYLVERAGLELNVVVWRLVEVSRV
jgi:hypothetical protein